MARKHAHKKVNPKGNALKAAFLRAKDHPQVAKNGRPKLTLASLAKKIAEATKGSVSVSTLTGKNDSSWFTVYPYKYHRPGSKGERELHREKIRGLINSLVTFVDFDEDGRAEFILQFIREARAETGQDVWFDVKDRFEIRAMNVDPFGPLITIDDRSSFPELPLLDVTFEALLLAIVNRLSFRPHDTSALLCLLMNDLPIGDGSMTHCMLTLIDKADFYTVASMALKMIAWTLGPQIGTSSISVARLGIKAQDEASDVAKLFATYLDSKFQVSFANRWRLALALEISRCASRLHAVLAGEGINSKADRLSAASDPFESLKTIASFPTNALDFA